MDDKWLDLWRRSGYVPHVRDVMDPHAVMCHALQDIGARLGALDPEIMTDEELARVKRFLAKARQAIDPDVRRGIPQAYEYIQALGNLLRDEQLLQLLRWDMDAFSQWLQHLRRAAGVHGVGASGDDSG